MEQWMCDGGWEWWAGGRWIRECDIISRVFNCARLAEWDLSRCQTIIIIIIITTIIISYTAVCGLRLLCFPQCYTMPAFAGNQHAHWHLVSNNSSVSITTVHWVCTVLHGAVRWPPSLMFNAHKQDGIPHGRLTLTGNHRTSTIRGGRRRGNISPPTCSCPRDLCDLLHSNVITPGLLEVSALRFVTHTVRLVRLRFLLLTEPKSLSRIGSRSSVVLINSISYSLLLYSRFLTSFLCLHPVRVQH